MAADHFVYAIFNFPGTNDEDLPLQIGDRIQVLQTDDEFSDGWWEGRNEAGRVGLFPKIYTADVMPPPSTTASSLHESVSRVDESPDAPVAVDVNSPQLSLADSANTRQTESLRAKSPVATTQRSTAGPLTVETSTAPATAPSAPSDQVEKWTPADVTRHFRELGLGETADKFTQHEVSGNILLSMHHEDLKEIDIMAFGKRFEIMREIDNLKQRTEASVLTPIEPLAFSADKNKEPRRESRVLAGQSATGALLQDMTTSETDDAATAEYDRRTSGSTGLSDGRRISAPRAVVPGSNAAALESAATLAPRNTSSPQPSPELANARNVSPQRSHRKSMSTTSAALMLGNEAVTGRRSPDKAMQQQEAGHGRSWSQDTVKMPSTHQKTNSGNLSSVREGVVAAGSVGGGSSDSAPRSPSSTLGSPMSNGAPMSPKTAQSRGAVAAAASFGSGAKRALLGQRKPKWQPNAVSQNLENVAASEAAKDADHAGYMRKRSERAYSWKLRYFVLRGTRLAFYSTDKDGQEQGIIDINSYRVIAVDDILFYSPTKFTFKLVPPAPGATRSLNFTPPKTHYFCTDSREALRDWMAAFTKATIGRDWSTPVISSCTTKTISLKEAQAQRAQQQQAQQAGAHGIDTSGIGKQLDPALDLDMLPDSPVAARPPGFPATTTSSGTTTIAGPQYRRPLVSPLEEDDDPIKDSNKPATNGGADKQRNTTPIASQFQRSESDTSLRRAVMTASRGNDRNSANGLAGTSNGGNGSHHRNGAF
ncbi:hypothetical protein PYCC9005_004054 [Savitreella phatthalungensis]